MPDAFRFNGLTEFEKALIAFEGVAAKRVSQAIYSLSYRILVGAVRGTPQWSGGAVASWRVGIGAPVYEDRTEAYKDKQGYDLFSMVTRNRDAEAEALVFGEESLARYTLGMGTIHILNAVDYAAGFPSGNAGPDRLGVTVALRTVNRPQRTMYHMLQTVLMEPLMVPGLTTQPSLF